MGEPAEVDGREIWQAWREIQTLLRAAKIPDRVIDIGCITHVAMMIIGQEIHGNKEAKDEMLHDLRVVYDTLGEMGFAVLEVDNQVVEEIRATREANPGLIGPDGKPVKH